MKTEEIEKINKILNKLKTNDFTYYFLMPDVDTPNSSMYEIYRNASVLKRLGFDVVILTEGFEYEKPYWIKDRSLMDIPHMKMSADITIGPEDFMIIPEIFTNIMERIKNINCEKIVFLQSMDYALHALLPGVEYTDFGIFNVLTVSETMNNYVKEFFNEFYNVQHYDIGIPDYFKYDGRNKKPLLSFIGRNGVDINRIVKLFYLKFPYLRFLTFQDLSNMDREAYAEKLKDSFALLWVDNISSASIVPLEAMKAHCLTIGVVPEIKHDYINDNNGYWTYDKYSLPALIAKALGEFLEDEIKPSLFTEMEKTASSYDEDKTSLQLEFIYKSYVDKRIGSFEKLLEDNKTLSE